MSDDNSNVGFNENSFNENNDSVDIMNISTSENTSTPEHTSTPESKNKKQKITTFQQS